MDSVHEQLICDIISESEPAPEVIGVLLQGSLARGDGYAASDLDLFLLLRDRCLRPFVSEQRHGILVEQHASDIEHAMAKVRANPMLAYGFVDGRILRDDNGDLAKLADIARAVIASYQISSEERAGILYWLRSAQIKIQAAKGAGDLLKASFIAATTSWKILEGMWAVNNLPMPPSGAVLAHRKDLTHVPENWDALFDRLFTANTAERIDAALAIIEWLIEADTKSLLP